MSTKPVIAVVEDEPVSAAYLMKILSMLHYSVVGPFSSGEELLSQIAIIMPDLVLMDITLEGEMDGVETAALLKKRYDLPTVFITGATDRETMDRARRSQAYGYVIKPFDELNVISTVEIALDMADMGNELKKQSAFLKTMLNAIPMPVYYKDLQGQYMGCNRPMEEYFDVREKDLVGKTPLYLQDKGFDPVYHEYYEKEVLASGSSIRYRVKMVNYLEEEREAVFIKSAFRDEDDKVAGVVGVIEDITEKLALELEYIDAVTEERSRIGRDLHDSLGQELTGISMALGAMKMDLQEKGTIEESDIDTVIQSVTKSLNTARGLARGLSPLELDDLDLMEAVAVLCHDVSRQTGIDVDYSQKGDFPDVEIINRDHVYYIIRESINNAVKHSGCDTIEVFFAVYSDKVTIEIQDNGLQSKFKSNNLGIGMKLIRYRADLMGCDVNFINRDDGHVVSLTCNLSAREKRR